MNENGIDTFASFVTRLDTYLVKKCIIANIYYSLIPISQERKGVLCMVCRCCAICKLLIQGSKGSNIFLTLKEKRLILPLYSKTIIISVLECYNNRTYEIIPFLTILKNNKYW